MNDIEITSGANLGSAFVQATQEERIIRDRQLKEVLGKIPEDYRTLTGQEISLLEKQNNRCRNWETVYVSDSFNTSLLYNNEFSGLIRIGAMQDLVLKHHDRTTRVGIYNSNIVACDIGDNCSIHLCSYLAHYIVGDSCILLSNDEIHVSNHAKFGVGIIKDGEDEDVRIWIDLMNEAGEDPFLPARKLPAQMPTFGQSTAMTHC